MRKKVDNTNFQSLQVYNLSVYFTSLQRDSCLLTLPALYKARYGQQKTSADFSGF